MLEASGTSRVWVARETLEAEKGAADFTIRDKAAGIARRRRTYAGNHDVLLIALLALAAVIASICAVRLSGMAEDDSLIHRRIALNYAQLGKPYFNTDERVMVTSSPVWTVLLAVAGRALPVANPVPLLDVVFLLMGAAAGYLLVKHVVGGDVGMALAFPALAFVYVCVGDFPSFIGQMETPCAIALILCGLLGVIRKRSWGMPLLLLACFTRYECVVLLGMAGIWTTLRREWSKWSVAGCVAIAAAGTAWLLREYGTLIPNTVIAKSHLYAMTYRQVLGQLIATRLWFVACVPAALLWWFYGRDRWRKPSSVVILLGGFGVILASAYLGRRTFVFAWYLPLVWIPISLAVLLWTDIRRFKSAAVGAIFAGLLLIPFAGVDAKLLLAAMGTTQHEVAGFSLIARVHEYRQVAAALQRACPSGVLLTSEIGALGWEFHGKILDGAGLATPAAIRFHPMRIPEERSTGDLGEIPAGFVRESRPDLIVSYDFFMESSLPAARGLGYSDYSYPPFIRKERDVMNGLWKQQRLHVLVAPAGRCSAPAIDRVVHEALEQ
jgi:hypothetical protein